MASIVLSSCVQRTIGGKLPAIRHEIGKRRVVEDGGYSNGGDTGSKKWFDHRERCGEGALLQDQLAYPAVAAGRLRFRLYRPHQCRFRAVPDEGRSAFFRPRLRP